MSSLMLRVAIAMRSAIVSAAIAVSSPDAHAATISEVTFSDYTALSGNRELARRFLSPLDASQLTALTTGVGKVLRDQPVDLANEKFVVYVPENKPAGGYALFVFVPPWNAARVPPGWTDVFDEHGIIFVSAETSGNDQSVLGRRIPLALLAEQNVVQHYPVDAAHVFIGGFSGGSRVALRIALAYPDVFHGVVLNSGSDPIGDHEAILPARERFAQFQDTTRLVYVTGDDDTFIRQTDFASRHSLDDWCVSHVDVLPMHATAHAPANPDVLSRAFDRLLSPPEPADPNALESCRAKIDGELEAKLQNARSLIAGGRRDEAKALLDDIDQHYGWLAAPAVVDLSTTLGAK